MKTIAIILIVTGLIGGPAVAARAADGELTIRGVILGIDGQPIDGATIRLEGKNLLAFSNSRGQFVMVTSAPAKVLALIVQADGYHDHRLRIRSDRTGKPLEVVMIPREMIREEISVTAMNEAEKSVSVPVAESVVTELDIREAMPEHVVETMQKSPGVHFIGKGGFTVTPSIRGLARRRVLLLVDGTRVTGDRAAGVSAAYLAPELVQRIEVVRSASSVVYGSDAIGGVMQLITRPRRPIDRFSTTLNLGWHANNDRLNTGAVVSAPLGPFSLHSGIQYTRASNYFSPHREILNSGYTTYSGTFHLAYRDDDRVLAVGYVAGVGEDIGRPEKDNDPDRVTTVPLDASHTVHLYYRDSDLVKDADLSVLAYVNPTTYRVERLRSPENSREFSDTGGLNFGLRTDLKRRFTRNFSLRVGLEWFARRDFDFLNRSETVEGMVTGFPLRDGFRDDSSFFITADFSGWSGWDILGGVRYTWFSLGGEVEGREESRHSGAPSAFLGITRTLSPGAAVFLNIGRAYRMPALSESFYSGISGRRYIVGNPDLAPETSVNIDAGLKLYSQKLYVGFYLFSFTVNDMIERFQLEDGSYSYDNIESGTIGGAEAEIQFFPLKQLELNAHAHYLRGKNSVSGDPLNDIPAPGGSVAAKLMLDRFWMELEVFHSLKKEHPGPAEITHDAYTVVGLKGGYYFSSRIYLFLRLSNLLDESYYANPDPDIPRSKGFDASVGVQVTF